MNHNLRIGRTIYETTCKGVYLDVEKKAHDFSEILYGNISEKKAINRLRKKFGTESLIISDMRLSSKYVSMTIEDFVKYGDVKESVSKRQEKE